MMAQNTCMRLAHITRKIVSAKENRRTDSEHELP